MKHILCISLTIILLLTGCGNSGNSFVEVEGVGWKVAEGATYTEQEYKEKCSDPLPFETYDNNPAKYKGVMYAVTGEVSTGDLLEEREGSKYWSMLIKNDSGYATSVIYKAESEYGINQKVTVYGEFQEVLEAGGILIVAKFIDERS